jgi:hypothetical protein
MMTGLMMVASNESSIMLALGLLWVVGVFVLHFHIGARLETLAEEE